MSRVEHIIGLAGAATLAVLTLIWLVHEIFGPKPAAGEWLTVLVYAPIAYCALRGDKRTEP